MQELVDDLRRQRLDSPALALRELGETRLGAGELLGPDLLCMAPERRDRGSCTAGASPLGKPRRLLGDDPLGLAHVLLAADEPAPERIDVVKRAAVDIRDLWVEIARDRDVDQHKRLRPRLDSLGVQDRIGAARRRDDDVGVSQLDRDRVERRRPAADALGELLRALERPAGDDHLGPARAQITGRELAHPARAEEERAPAFEALELPGRQVDRRSGDGLRHLGQLRFGADALAGVEGLLEEAVQDRARRIRPQRCLVREAHLAEDLRLARHERVEPCGDTEEVLDCLASLPRREDALELEAGKPLQGCARHLRIAAFGVDLGPVASREHDRAELLRELDRVPVGEVEALAQLKRRVPVRHTDCEQVLCWT